MNTTTTPTSTEVISKQESFFNKVSSAFPHINTFEEAIDFMATNSISGEILESILEVRASMRFNSVSF